MIQGYGYNSLHAMQRGDIACFFKMLFLSARRRATDSFSEVHTMKVLMINGSPHEHGCTDAALREVAGVLESHGIETEFYWIGTRAISGCIACGGCKKGNGCAIGDDVNVLGNRLSTYDGIVIGSPVYYAGPNGALCAFLDRLFYSYGGRLAGKPAACVVSCRRGGASAAFDRLNKYFTICNMPVVSSQYWNQVHGSKAEDVYKDEEGMQTMRTLGRNMAWLLCGMQNNPLPPSQEPKMRTSFIR